MKRIFAAAIAVSIAAISCKKEGGNTGVIVKESTEGNTAVQDGAADGAAVQTREHTVRYVAEDGSSAHVTFSNSGEDGNYISISSNKKTIKVKQVEARAKGAVYEENGITVTSEGDLIKIEQGGNVIELKKARGQ